MRHEDGNGVMVVRYSRGIRVRGAYSRGLRSAPGARFIYGLGHDKLASQHLIQYTTFLSHSEVLDWAGFSSHLPVCSPNTTLCKDFSVIKEAPSLCIPSDCAIVSPAPPPTSFLPTPLFPLLLLLLHLLSFIAPYFLRFGNSLQSPLRSPARPSLFNPFPDPAQLRNIIRCTHLLLK